MSEQTFLTVAVDAATHGTMRSAVIQLAGRSSATTRLGFIGNFECERWWSPPNVIRLPGLTAHRGGRFLDAMAELALPSLEPSDTVFVSHEPDPSFIDYLNDLGFDTPRCELIPRDYGDDEPISGSAHLRDRIRAASAASPLCLLCHGNTTFEEALADSTGARLAGATPDVCARVNSKIYSRRVAARLGLTQVPGWECETVADLSAASRLLDAGLSVYVKEAYGVSGKGLAGLTSAAELAALVRRLQARADIGGIPAFVVEERVPVRTEINYQLFVPTHGRPELVCLHESLTSGGVHVGHRWPARLTETESAAYGEAATRIGTQLQADGYVGIAGVDSVIAVDGTVYPVLEINARLNMSTYELPLRRFVDAGSRLAVKTYTVKLSRNARFSDLEAALGDALFRPSLRGEGVGVLAFGGMEHAVQPGCPVGKGRLTAFYVSRSREAEAGAERQLLSALAQCGGVVGEGWK